MLNSRLPVSIDSHLHRAFIESLFSTFLCAIVVGIVFLPDEMERSRPLKRVQFCTHSIDGKVLFALVASMNMWDAAEKNSNHLERYDLSKKVPFPQAICEKLNPQCAAVDARNGRLFLIDMLGRLYATGLDSSISTHAFHGQVPGGRPKSMACTQDGRKVIVLNHEGLFLWNVDSHANGVASPHWSHLEGEIVCFALNPDSDTAVLGRFSELNGKQTDLVEVNIQTGETKMLFVKKGWRMVRLAISSNGRSMVGVEDSGEMMLLQRTSDSEAWEHRSIPGLCTGTSNVACFSPDSSLLITTDRYSRRLVAWNLDQKEICNKFETNPTIVVGCSFLNEDQFLSWGVDPALRVWNLSNNTLERKIQLSP